MSAVLGWALQMFVGICVGYTAYKIMHGIAYLCTREKKYVYWLSQETVNKETVVWKFSAKTLIEEMYADQGKGYVWKECFRTNRKGLRKKQISFLELTIMAQKEWLK